MDDHVTNGVYLFVFRKINRKVFSIKDIRSKKTITSIASTSHTEILPTGFNLLISNPSHGGLYLSGVRSDRFEIFGKYVSYDFSCNQTHNRLKKLPM